MGSTSHVTPELTKKLGSCVSDSVFCGVLVLLIKIVNTTKLIIKF